MTLNFDLRIELQNKIKLLKKEPIRRVVPTTKMKKKPQKFGTSYYVFIKTTRGEAFEVSERLKEIPGIKQLHHTVTGEYDIIAFLETKSIKELGDVISEIQDSKEVTATLTSIVLD